MSEFSGGANCSMRLVHNDCQFRIRCVELIGVISWCSCHHILALPVSFAVTSTSSVFVDKSVFVQKLSKLSMNSSNFCIPPVLSYWGMSFISSIDSMSSHWLQVDWLAVEVIGESGWMSFGQTSFSWASFGFRFRLEAVCNCSNVWSIPLSLFSIIVFISFRKHEFMTSNTSVVTQSPSVCLLWSPLANWSISMSSLISSWIVLFPIASERSSWASCVSCSCRHHQCEFLSEY